MDIKKFWDKGLSYDEFIKHTEKAQEEAKEKGNEEYEQYYELGLQRMARTHKTYKPNQEQSSILENKKFDGKVLVIAEGWCGDCSNAVPVVTKFFEENGVEVKMSLRDQEPSLIHDFKTDGKEEIPKVLLLDNEYNVISTWGSRPQAAIELYKKYKQGNEDYTVDDFHADLLKYYIKNKGKDTIEEILGQL